MDIYDLFNEDFEWKLESDTSAKDSISDLIESVKYRGISLEVAVRDIIKELESKESQALLNCLAEVIVSYVNGRTSKKDTLSRILSYKGSKDLKTSDPVYGSLNYNG